MKNPFHEFWEATEDRAARSAATPPVGLMREYLAMTGGLVTDWFSYRRSARAYGVVLGEAFSRATGDLSAELMRSALKGEPLTNPKQLANLWVDVADRAFLDAAQRDEFAEAQGDFVNRSMKLKRRRRALLELLLNAQDMPTKTDVEEAHREIHALKREVRRLKKEVQRGAV